jgi:hypothetical protein
MLSRLASNVAARSSRTVTALPALTRDFHSSMTSKNSAAPATTHETEGPAAIVQKWGAPTFWGAFAAILVSKEIFILDAEFLLSCEIGLFALTGYVLTGDTFDKWSEEQDKAQIDKFTDASDFMLEMFTQYKGVQQVAQNKPAVIEAYLDAYKAANVENAVFQTVRPAHAARASVLAALEGIKSREEHAAAMEWQNAVDTAVANVRNSFSSGDAKLADEALNLAIQNLGTDPKADQPDPVKRLFAEQFSD